MLDIPFYQKSVVDSLIKEFEKHVQAVVGFDVIIQVDKAGEFGFKEHIELLVSEAFRVSPRLIKSQRKDRNIVYARFAIYYLLRHFGKLSFEQIGIITNRDHTTVIKGVRKISDFLSINDPLISEKLLPIIKIMSETYEQK